MRLTTRVMGVLAVLGLLSAAAHAADGPARTVQVTKEKAAAGRLVFQKCAVCHGSEAEGRVGMAPRLASKSFLAAASDAMLLNTISQGRTGTTMIPWGSILKSEELEAVIAFLRHETPTEPVALDETPVKGDAANGSKLYRDICAACHGRSGAGYQEAGSGTGIGRKAFLEQASDGFLRYIIKNGKSDTQMKPFDKKRFTAVADLSAREIEDVIAHLRAAAW